MGKYFVTEPADNSLGEIWLYSAQKWDPEQADKYLDELYSAFQKIADGKSVTYPRLTV